MTLVVLLLVPVALMSLAVHGLVLKQLWQTRRERPGFRDLRRSDQLAFAGTGVSALGLVALISLGYGRAGAWVLLAVLGSVAVVIVGLVPFFVWADRRGSPELQRRLFGRAKDR